MKLQQRFRSEAQSLFTETVYKITLSASDDKRLQSCEKLISYPYDTSAERVDKGELTELIMSQEKPDKSIIRTGGKFLAVHTEY